MDINNILNEFGVIIPLATLGLLGWLVKLLVDGIISMFNIENGMIKRLILVLVVVVVYLLYLWREVPFVYNFIVPIFAIGFIASGFDFKAKEQNKEVNDNYLEYDNDYIDETDDIIEE